MYNLNRSDNTVIRELFEYCGIENQITVPYSPQQNQRVEREIMTIVEMTGRSIIKNKTENDLWFNERFLRITFADIWTIFFIFDSKNDKNGTSKYINIKRIIYSNTKSD